METKEKPKEELSKRVSLDEYIAQIGSFYNNNMVITLAISPEGIKLIAATKIDNTFLPVHLEWHNPKNNYIG